jgi:hypothetical protein
VSPDSGASGNIVPSQVGQIYIILFVNYNGVSTNYNLNSSGTVSISKVVDAGLSSLSLSFKKSTYLISSYYSAYLEIYMTYCYMK